MVTAPHGPGPADRRAGQVMIFLIMALVVLVFVVFYNLDLRKIIGLKSTTQNAGDAAAVAAARWQGITLNLIGDLNVMQAIALAEGDSAASESITNLQARLCFTGPMIALAASQQAAKQNRIYAHPDFEAIMREHARAVREDYPTEVDRNTGLPLFPEPYEGCWEAYAAMLESVADSGVAAGPDNTRRYSDGDGGHLLLRIDFYEAIAGENWCWFYHNAPDLLETYVSYEDWPPLPDPSPGTYHNSEVFGLGLVPVQTTLSPSVTTTTLQSITAARLYDGDPAAGMSTQATWYAFANNRWDAWTIMRPGGGDTLPVVGELRPQYDYVGADAAVRVEATLERITPGAGGAAATNTILWTAAAKPFGYLNETDRPNAFSLVLPAFHDARLIPVDASTAPSGGAYNIAWLRHVHEHLPIYMERGPGGISCWYCRQLVTWEIPSFRGRGVLWLEENSWRCTINPPGPGGPGGGTRRGH